MGVISKSRKELSSDYTIEDYLIDNAVGDSDSDIDLPPVAERQLGQRKFKLNKRRTGLGSAGQIAPSTQGRSSKQNLGARKLRRLENFKLLRESIKEEDICDDLSDMLPPSTESPLSQLFLEERKMKLWNWFVELSEEEQRKILASSMQKLHDVNCGASREHCYTTEVREKENNDLEIVENVADKRAAHPAYSSEECFKIIRNKYRNIFRKEHLPLGKLEALEEQLVEHFKDDPDSVWIANIENVFERLLLHAIAEYLLLRSQSRQVASTNGTSHVLTEVVNPYNVFIPPRYSFVELLTQAHAAR